jgi:hypothetical protein
MTDKNSANDASQDQAMCLTIPTVSAFDWEDWECAAQALSEGARLDFGQSWFAEPEPDFQPATVWLGIQDEYLIVYAVLRDNVPANRATSWNEPTWTTGDVLELFFQAEGRPGYYEFHVTPENQRLQLFFPSTAAFQEKRGHRYWAVEESQFDSLARVNSEQDGWVMMMRIKLSLVLDEPRADGSRRFRFLFSRYDYQPGRAKPVTSATAPMNKPNFHNIPEWSWAEAKPSNTN